MIHKLTTKNIEEACRHLITDKTFSCDTETTGLGWLDRAFMVGFMHRDGVGYYIRDTDPKFKELVAWVIAYTNDDCEPVFANAKFDLHRLAWLTGNWFKRVHDVIVLDQLLHPEVDTHKLKAIGSRLFGATEADEQGDLNQWFDDNNEGKKEFWKVPDSILLPYFEKDLDLTNRVFSKLQPELNQHPKLPELYGMERELLLTVLLMERQRVLIDREYLTKFQAELNSKQVGLLKQLRKGFKVNEEFNFSSSDQLSDLLYTQLGYEIKKKTYKGAPSCDDEALSQIAHPYIETLKEFKLNDTYLTKFIEPWLDFSRHDGRLHASFNTTGAISGRFTCERPNMQQIMQDPKILKALKVSDGKVCGQSDLSQIEMVGAAWYMRDEQMLKSLRAGTDLHRDTASILFGKPAEQVDSRERRIAKGMNFSVIYGCGKAKLAGFLSQHTGTPVPLEEAAMIRELYHKKYPGIKQFVYRVMDTIRARPDRVIKNFFGRRYFIQPQKEYVGVNRLVQGWAAYIAKYAMIRLSKKLDWDKTYLNCQVHDMLSWECDPSDLEATKRLVEDEMTRWPEFDIPIKVDTKILKDTWEA